MRIDVITIFPELFEVFLGCSIVGRARGKGLIELAVHDLRGFTADKHHTVDDTPYGGGPGMVMKPEPWFRALRAVLGGEERGGSDCEVVLLSPRGERLSQRLLDKLSRLEWMVLLCGRYEGIDDRVRERWATMEVSIGDFVINGGELAAQVIIEGVTRLLPGALGDPESAVRESFSSGLLDYRQFTKPAVLEGAAVPEVLLGGNHEKIRRWRLLDSLRATAELRPDLLERADLSEEEKALLLEIKKEKEDPGRANE